MTEHVDVVVLGMGAGGEEVASRLAEAGLAVVGAEHRLVGGECPYWGSVPTKVLVRAANLLAEARRADGTAGRVEVEADWRPVAARIRDVTAGWSDQAAVDRFTGRGGRLVRGHGRLAGPGRVEVAGQTYEASAGVVLATGSEPTVPPIDGLAGTPFWTSREAVTADALPGSLVVLGAGSAGLELAQAYARFGVAVTLVEAAERVLPDEEPEASHLVRQALTAEGVDVRVGTRGGSVSHDGGVFTVTVTGGHELTAERLLVTVGRRVDLEDLGVDSVGLDPHAHAVRVDERLRAAERLWAVGDVTGLGTHAHVALYQAGVVVRDILGQVGPAADYHALPRVTFTDPEVGAVGLTEAGARRSGIHPLVGVGRVGSTALDLTRAADRTGLVKLVVDADRGVLVGATSVGPAGGEVLSGLAVAVHAQVPVNALRHMIYAYPTYHRGIEDALEHLGHVG